MSSRLGESITPSLNVYGIRALNKYSDQDNYKKQKSKQQQHHHQPQQQQQQKQKQKQTMSETSQNAKLVDSMNSNSNFSTAKLPIEIVKRLIHAVSKRPELYKSQKQTNGRHKRPGFIQALWLQVAEEVELPADICRIKWGHLRDNFRKVFIRNTLQPNSNQHPTTWRFYADMQFMEKIVAENIMRQNRIRKGSFSPDLQIMQHQHFLQAAKVFQNNLSSNFMQFPMEEAQMGENIPFLDPYILPDLHRSTKRQRMEYEARNMGNKALYSNGGDQQQQEVNDEDYDTEFDEDAATDENEQKDATDQDDAIKARDDSNSHTSRSEMGINHMLTIELDDDDDNFVKNNKHQGKSIKVESLTCSYGEPSNSYPFETPPDTEVNDILSARMSSEIEDADRMFLLSLLPYLRKVDGTRKLNVRQKLQDVLIQEFNCNNNNKNT